MILLDDTTCFYAANYEYQFYQLQVWIIGEVNENCDISCQKHNLSCSETEMWRHNSDVDTSEKLAKLIDKIDKEANFSSCDNWATTASDVPNFSTLRNFCMHSKPGRPKDTFNCESIPRPEREQKKRVCFCFLPGFK